MLDKVRKWANEFTKELLVTDPRFKQTSLVVHMDGSTILSKNSFLTVVDDQWVCLFPEHGLPTVWYKGDLRTYSSLLPTKVNKITLDRPKSSKKKKVMTIEKVIRKVVGMTEEGAHDLIRRNRFTPRTTKRDLKPMVVTRDYKADRVNLEVLLGEVMRATLG